MNQYIKFTFNFDNVFNQFKSKDFSDFNGKTCKIDYDRIIMQNDLLQILGNSSYKGKGVCTLVSIYNAFPDVFKDINELADFLKYELKLGHKYGNLEEMTKEINKLKSRSLLYDDQDLENSFLTCKDQINQNKPIVISYEYSTKSLLIPNFGQHTIVITGYNDQYIQYVENSQDDYLFSSLAIYLSYYYKVHPVMKNNPEYDRILEFLNESDVQKAMDIAKSILGYNSSGKLRILKKSVLINKTYFNDINRMIIHPKPLDYECFSTNQFDAKSNFSNISKLYF